MVRGENAISKFLHCPSGRRELDCIHIFKAIRLTKLHYRGFRKVVNKPL